jgi:hypothetical protein
MAHVTFAYDPKPSMDATLDAIGNGAAALQKPIRCRFQPDLYDWGRTSYTSWHGLTWTIECQDVAEGRRLREGLTSFFQVFGGSERQQTRLLLELERIAVKVRG